MIDGFKVQSSNHCWPSLHYIYWKKTDSVIIKGIDPWLLLTYQFFFENFDNWLIC
jgi:hypothetical protein